MRLLALFWLVLSIPVLSSELRAQPLSLKEGARVRVLAPQVKPHSIIGRVNMLTDKAFVLEIAEPEKLTVPFSAVEKIELSQGYHRNTGKGALIGALAGGIGTIATALVFDLSEGCSFHPTDCAAFELVLAVLLAPVVAVPGALLGALVGSQIRSERWENLSLDVRLGFAPPQRVGFDTGLSL